jgi:hypothetical protein
MSTEYTTYDNRPLSGIAECHECRDRAGAKYDPQFFCSEKCGDTHLQRTGRCIP